MVALSPLLEPRLQIEISQSAEPGNVPYALCIGTMTGVTGRDIGLRYSLHVDRASRSHEAPVAVIGWSGRNRRKIGGEITRGLRAERSDRTPHVLLRKRIIPYVLVKISDLLEHIERQQARLTRQAPIAPFSKRCASCPHALAHQIRPEPLGDHDTHCRVLT